MTDNTANTSLEALDADILEIQNKRDEDKEILRQLVDQREKLTAGAVWNEKLGNMNEAEIAALEDALAQRQLNTQSLGVTGINSKEGVNGQDITYTENLDNV